MAQVDDYPSTIRRIHASVTQPARPRAKQHEATITIKHCVYCGSPTLKVVCAAHLDLLGDLEAER